ncbi:MAG TPA: WG repeat-containing protein [Flavobacterium sp.]|nr:WG repeat-containing protein [Flavobacterium sp.]
MKKLLIILLIIPVIAYAQTTEQLDFIAPFSDDVAAVKKGDSWGFINKKGAIVIAFRNDLVLSEIDGYKYPVFKNNRCLISENKNGITYFGYIDKTGEKVIPPKFLNASNFNNNKAIVLEIAKEKLGTNNVLGKDVINYRYYEVTIDSNGNVENYLNPKGTHIVLNKKFLKTPPKITSKKISNNMYAVITENKKWKIVVINN